MAIAQHLCGGACFSALLFSSSFRLVLASDDAFVLFYPSLLAVFSERLFSVLICHIAGNGYLPVLLSSYFNYFGLLGTLFSRETKLCPQVNVDYHIYYFMMF